jgi:tetratricopeptide (TPR) repeat protein
LDTISGTAGQGDGQKTEGKGNLEAVSPVVDPVVSGAARTAAIKKMYAGANADGDVNIPPIKQIDPTVTAGEGPVLPLTKEQNAASEQEGIHIENGVNTTNPSAAATAYDRASGYYLQAGDYAGAERTATEAISLKPADTQAWTNRARARLAAGDHDGAISDARKALSLDPQNGMARLIIGHSDELSQAQTGVGAGLKKLDFGKALENSSIGSGSNFGTVTGPTSAQARIAATLASLPATPAAPTPSQRSIAGNPSAATYTPAQTLYFEAIDMFRMHDRTSALLAVRQSIDTEPKSAKSWALMADIENELGNYKGTLKATEEALKIEPANAQALRAKAYAEYSLGDYHQAYTDALQSISLDSKSGLGYLYLAMAEEKLGSLADALNHYDQAVSLDTTLAPMAQEALARLRGTSPTGLTNVAQSHLLRGGAAALALALVLLGLGGAAARKQLSTTAKRLLSSAASDAATVLDSVPASVRVGTILNKNYRITGELGRGGMGVVYDAFDEALQRKVAIKQLQRDERTTSADMDRFLQEARLVAQLKHPHLAEIYTVINEGDLFLVFEHVDGQPLDKTLSVNKKLPSGTVRKLVAEIGAALDYAHGRKIIHRDLKPSNIMVTRDGFVKVMDFGIAHQSQNGRNMTMTAASGTPPYMAPEQALGSVSKASDLYALAVMSYEMLTGVRPFEGPDFLEQKLRKVYLPPSRRDSSLPQSLDAFFDIALDPDPTKRPASGDEFLQAFSRACRPSAPAERS